jgi:hypothetical protein
MLAKPRNFIKLYALLNNNSKIGLFNKSNLIKCFSTQSVKQIKSQSYLNDYHILNSVYADDGSINPNPKFYRLGLVKVLAAVTAWVLLGSYISQSTAEFLEDNEIFVPEDDDD